MPGGNDAVATPILVFARAPVPGQVKSRLAESVGAVRAATLYDAWMEAAVTVAVGARLGPVTLYCAPDPSHPRFREIARRHGVGLAAQEGADLGERMHRALATALAGAGAAILIGTDCPSLDTGYLRQAARLLADRSAPVVIGPARDGGYVLLGASRLDPALFLEVPWGGPRVLETTRARLTTLGWTWRELAPLQDMDRPEDLAFLESRPHG
ncbi:MAG: TIGR04282 family arsenosugar biosynthesis glycosyltransferase [Gammaproteobacteria bacterium]|nr:TIGR04282 family arsenosugar biosynthesis glycosyltransferase [Gammaproteobacteria bacterium]